MKLKKMNSNNILLMITIALFVIMYIVAFNAFNAQFGHFQKFLDILAANSGLLCVACGLTCVMLTGGIDISVGSLVALDCMIMAVGFECWKMNTVMVIALVLVVGVLFGLMQGFFVSYMKIQPFIVTMAGMFFGRGLTAMLGSLGQTSQKSFPADSLFTKLASVKITLPFGGYTISRRFGGDVYMPAQISAYVLVAFLIVIIVFLMLRYTKFGRNLYAVGGNETSASMMGLDVKKTKLFAYVLSSVLCSIGAILYAMNAPLASLGVATGFEMDAIASSVIGGTMLTGGVGNVIGTFFGVLINGVISNIASAAGLASSWPSIIMAALLCFFIVLQSVFAWIQEKRKG